MILKTAGDLMNGKIYAMVYGKEGAGKTMLAMTTSRRDDGKDVAFITGDYTGATSVVSAGYSPDIPVVILPGHRENPFKAAVKAINYFAKLESVRTIVLDGCTTISAGAMMHYGLSEGRKLEFDDWNKVLAGFHKIEGAAYEAVLGGKSFLYTAWEKEPREIETAGGTDTEMGRPWIHGQGKTWLPGKCDMICRITSSSNPKGEWKGKLLTTATDEWLAKTRWKVPMYCPADLGAILRMVRDQKKAATGKAEKKSKK